MMRVLLIGGLLASAAPALAAETVTYTYDALGRLVTVTHAGGDNNALKQTISYDPAGNRTEYKVENSKNRGLPENAVIVLPLNGFTIIPIGQ